MRWGARGQKAFLASILSHLFIVRNFARPKAFERNASGMSTGGALIRAGQGVKIVLFFDDRGDQVAAPILGRLASEAAGLRAELMLGEAEVATIWKGPLQ